MESTTGDRLLRVAEVAERLGLSRAGVYELFDAGKLAGVSPSAGGKSRRVKASEVDRFIQSLTATAGSGR
jgi:excisionase family DNA binding protein